MSTTALDTQAIREAVESFLEDWKRHEWMAEHGEWASSKWDEMREGYEQAYSDIESDLENILDEVSNEGSNADASAIDDAISLATQLVESLKSLREIAHRLSGQVMPNDSDYIAEGTIDPDGVAGVAELVVDSQWSQGWDCKEGWSAYRHGDALYVRWMRDAWGQRHDRDLWALVDGEYFSTDDD